MSFFNFVCITSHTIYYPCANVLIPATVHLYKIIYVITLLHGENNSYIDIIDVANHSDDYGLLQHYHSPSWLFLLKTLAYVDFVPSQIFNGRFFVLGQIFNSRFCSW